LPILGKRNRVGLIEFNRAVFSYNACALRIEIINRRVADTRTNTNWELPRIVSFKATVQVAGVDGTWACAQVLWADSHNHPLARLEL
jgi:hypothetical protein